MRVLLDENVDRRLRRFFDSEHEVTTVVERGWAGKKDSQLLELAQRDFDVLVTADRNIPHQQNLSQLQLSIVILEAKSNALESLTPLMGELGIAMTQPQPGTARRISG